METSLKFDGDIVFDTNKPDGTPKKQLNVERLTNIGWTAKISLQQGLQETLGWCIKNKIFE